MSPLCISWFYFENSVKITIKLGDNKQQAVLIKTSVVMKKDSLRLIKRVTGFLIKLILGFGETV